MELENRRALVTGAGRGIGRAIALALAREGARLALLARTRSELETVAAEVSGLGRDALVRTADLAQPGQVTAAVQGVLEVWGGVDILVNNAGILGPIGPLHEADLAGWMRAVEINLGGCVRCTRLVLPGMIERGRGKIINLSGGGAVSPRPRFSAYGASKAAVVRFTETLSAEVSGEGIEVNAIAPGAVNTAMMDQVLRAGEAAGTAAQQEMAAQRQTGGVDPARPAALAVFLASARSDGLSGRLLSAVWDDWENIDIAKVMASELYTVRRLTPKNQEA
jgi:3-oxoacyl-[acyl-carrier protein] reductase